MLASFAAATSRQTYLDRKHPPGSRHRNGWLGREHQLRPRLRLVDRIAQHRDGTGFQGEWPDFQSHLVPGTEVGNLRASCARVPAFIAGAEVCSNVAGRDRAHSGAYQRLALGEARLSQGGEA